MRVSASARVLSALDEVIASENDKALLYLTHLSCAVIARGEGFPSTNRAKSINGEPTCITGAIWTAKDAVHYEQ